jgi:hypothetical protein
LYEKKYVSRIKMYNFVFYVILPVRISYISGAGNKISTVEFLFNVHQYSLFFSVWIYSV